MSKPRRAQLNNETLTRLLRERVIPVEARAVVDLRSGNSVAALARAGQSEGFEPDTIRTFAERQGRSRELLVYLLERASRHVRSWRASGFSGSVLFELRPCDLEDRTLSTSLDIIIKRHHLDPSAITVVVPLAEYLARRDGAFNAITRLRKIGIHVAMVLGGREPQHVKFRDLGAHPFTSAIVGGAGVWQRLRVAGPNKLGHLGGWIGWAEAHGLQRTALGIHDESALETARLFGFTSGAGTLLGTYRPARAFLPPCGEMPQAMPILKSA